MPATRPRIVAIGGTPHSGSSTEKALRHALDSIDAHTELISGEDLCLPLYDPISPAFTPAVERVITALGHADGVLLASPGYHGGLSGVMKNALDYVEFLRDDDRPYLSGRAVGCIANAAGWQGAMATLSALRDIVHALRGWPTPLGVCIAGPEKAFDQQGNCLLPTVSRHLQTVAHDVLEFAQMRQAQQAGAVPIKSHVKAA